MGNISSKKFNTQKVEHKDKVERTEKEHTDKEEQGFFKNWYYNENVRFKLSN
jgi:hypothetical protein